MLLDIILLDLSAAFDALDHNILLNCLRLSFGVSGTALDRLATYLTKRPFIFYEHGGAGGIWLIATTKLYDPPP